MEEVAIDDKSFIFALARFQVDADGVLFFCCVFHYFLINAFH